MFAGAGAFGCPVNTQWESGPAGVKKLGKVSTMTAAVDDDPLLTPAEVAALFRVDPKTVTRWAQAGKIGSIRTLGGHRRFRQSEVRALLEAAVVEDVEDQQ